MGETRRHIYRWAICHCLHPNRPRFCNHVIIRTYRNVSAEPLRYQLSRSNYLNRDHIVTSDASVRDIMRRLREQGQVLWDRASIDAASVPAPVGGEDTGRNPTDRSKLGCKHHGCRSAWTAFGCLYVRPQVHDSHLLVPLVEAIPAVKGLSGRARKRPGKLHADRAYASRAHRVWLRRQGIAAKIARSGVESRERLGRWRWVEERTLGWLRRFRRLRIHNERRADIHQAFLSLACTLICWRYVERFGRRSKQEYVGPYKSASFFALPLQELALLLRQHQ